MDNAFILDEKTLKRIPPAFTLIFVLLLGFPALVINYFGADLNYITNTIEKNNSLGIFITNTQIRSYFIQILLQWSAFSLATIAALLSFTQYRLTNNKIALIIGLSILFSGSAEALHTLLIDSLSPYISGKENIDMIIWTFTNSVSGIILIIGLLILQKSEKATTLSLTTLALLSSLLILIGLIFIYYSTFIINQFHSLKTNWAPQPYEVIYLSIYFIIIFGIYPRAYKKNPNILTNCILYMSITQIVIEIYLQYLSNTPYDSYNIAYFLKIIVYFIPFFCLIINYVFSYNTILEAQNNLQLNQEKLAYIASHDALTNLVNRREFESLLDMKIKNYSRDHEPFALFLIDIDNFKSINDTLGHLHGDSFLKKFSEQLAQLVRRGDVLARIGGDEFTVILSNLKSPTSARKFAERVLRELNIPFLVGEKLLTGTVSVGISIYPIDGDYTEELLKNADIAMYNAKKSGKNTYQFYTRKLSIEQHREAEIESHLRTALVNDELTLVYQPQYNLVSKEIIGAEILLRWYSQKLGNVPPDEFIPVAENSNLIIDIGDWVLHKACENAKRWSEKYHHDLIFSINVSPIQFTNNNFFVNFKKTVEKFKYPPNFLSIEVTENLLMKSTDEVNSALENIGSLGTIISLDDFGVGYSSLSRLNSLPIHTLKIDKLFVAEIHNSTTKVVVIDTIITLAHELGMNTIAEGIETQEQLDYLVANKCYIGQGYLLNRPLLPEVFEKLAYQANAGVEK